MFLTLLSPCCIRPKKIIHLKQIHCQEVFLFMSDLKLEPVARGEKYRLLEDISFLIGIREIFIPKGVEFDGASIPRLFWSIIGSPFGPEFMEADLIHDYCFYTKCCSFSDANKVFKAKLKLNGVSAWRRHLMYCAVASAGFIFWKREDEENLRTIFKSISTRWDWFLFEKDIRSAYYLKYYKNKGVYPYGK